MLQIENGEKMKHPTCKHLNLYHVYLRYYTGLHCIHTYQLCAKREFQDSGSKISNCYAFSRAMCNLVRVLHIYDCEKNNASRPDGEVFSFSMYDKFVGSEAEWFGASLLRRPWPQG